MLTTLEWPPYTGASLPGNGISAAIVTAAYAAEGVQVRYIFMPWNRAMHTAARGCANGFFPSYRRPANPSWVISDTIGSGPIYFAERKDRPISWSSLDDLRSVSIGVDAGYVNTAEIDRRLADGRLHGDIASSDVQNLKKLAGHRIDLAIIDANVFHFLSALPQLMPVTVPLQLQAKPLEDKALFVDFRNDAEGRHFRDLLDQGLLKIKATPTAIAALKDSAVTP